MQIAFYKGSWSLWKDPAKLIAHIAICVRTLSKYSHAELVIDRVCYSSSARDKGVRGKVIDLTNGHWDVREVHEFWDGPEAQANAFKWFEAYNDVPYDWWGVIRFALPFVKQKPDQWFCSEAVAAALGHQKPESFSPEDLKLFTRT
jgi:hypothetical protein